MADEPTPNETVGSGTAILAIESAQKRAELAAVAAEESRQRAASESALAEEARQQAEIASNLVAQIKDTVRTNARWLSTTSPNDLLQQLEQLKSRAEVAAAAAEEANRKANSEAGYAFNAKQYSEEHGKTIAQIKGTVEADFNWLVTTKKNAESAADAIVAAKSTAENDARLATDARTTAEAEAVAIRASKDKAEAAQSLAENARDESTALAKRCAEDVAAITQAKANTEAAASAVSAMQAQSMEATAKVQADSETIGRRAAESQALLASMSDATETANNSYVLVKDYQEKIARLENDFAAVHAKIEALLPGATSAGLASSFRYQKTRFDRPQWMWGAIFIVSMFALAAAGFYGLHGLQAPANEQLSWQNTLPHILARLPIAVPLVWLALYAQRNFTLALRLQEDYAFKEAISTSFEGYKREMASITGNGSEQLVPILTLCDNVLRTLGQRPGRLYEGKHEDLTPLTPLSKFLKDSKFMNLFAKTKADQPSSEDSVK